MARWVVILFLSLVALPAGAEDKATKAAQKHFAQAQKQFNLGKFDAALVEYEAAYDAKPLPDFLYNIAQCYRNLEDYDRAIFSFKKYLKEKPDADDRAQVEKFIDELEHKKEAGEGQKFVEKKQDQPPPPPPPAAHESPFYKQWWFWTGVAVVGAATGLGVYEATKSNTPSTDLGNIGRVFSF
jgi:tetratricopeptide (TPR) repeat protein